MKDRPRTGIAATRERFGGFDLPATLIGTLTVLLLAGLIGSAIGAVGYQTGLDEVEEDLSTASVIGGLVVLFVAYVVGGWAAARIARYDGPRNGLWTGIWTIVLAAVLAGLGTWIDSEHDVLRNVELAQWFSEDALTAGAVVSGIVAILAMLAGGIAGGFWGERYHGRADTVIGSTASGTAESRERTAEER